MTDYYHNPLKLIAEAARNSGQLDAVAEFAWVARHNPNTAPAAEASSQCVECVLNDELIGHFLELSQEVDTLRKDLFSANDPKNQPGAQPGEFKDFLKGFGLDVLE